MVKNKFSFPITAILFFSTMLNGCATTYTKFVYRDDNDKLFYFSVDEPPLRIGIPINIEDKQSNWKFSSPNWNHLVLSNILKPRELINIVEMDDKGILHKNYFKKGFSEADALEEHLREEFKYFSSKDPNLKKTIISRNIEGPIQPNLLWIIEGPAIKIFYLTMARNNHIIVISDQVIDPPYGSPEILVQMFRSIQFIQKEEAESILRKIKRIKYLN